MVASHASIIVGCLWSAAVLAQLIVGSIFLWRYRKRYIIKGRGPFWTQVLNMLLLCLFGWLQMIILIFEHDLICFGPELATLLLTNLLCLMYAWRCWVLMFQFKIATKLDEYQKSRNAKSRAVQAANARKRLSDAQSAPGSPESEKKEVRLTIDTNMPSDITPAATPIAHQHTIMSESLTDGKGGWFVRNRNLMKFTLIPSIVWVTVVVVSIAVPIIFEVITPCDPTSSTNPVPRFNVASILFWAIVVMILAYKTANPGEDAFGIKRELTLVVGMAIPLIVAWYIVLTYFPTYYMPQQTVSAGVTLVLWFVSFAHPLYLARVGDAGLDFKGVANMRSLDDLIGMDTGFQSLLSYLKTEFSQENLLFYTQVKKFKETYGATDHTAFSHRARCLKNAQEIINTFVLSDAPMQVNISSECHYNLLHQWQEELKHEVRLPSNARINMVPNVKDANQKDGPENAMSIAVSPVDDADEIDEDAYDGQHDNDSHDSHDSRDDISPSDVLGTGHTPSTEMAVLIRPNSAGQGMDLPRDSDSKSNPERTSEAFTATLVATVSNRGPPGTEHSTSTSTLTGIGPVPSAHPNRLTHAVKKKERRDKEKLRAKAQKEKKAKVGAKALTTLTVAHIFDEAAKEIHKLMTRDSLPRYLRSDEFARFVTEMQAKSKAHHSRDDHSNHSKHDSSRDAGSPKHSRSGHNSQSGTKTTLTTEQTPSFFGRLLSKSPKHSNATSGGDRTPHSTSTTKLTPISSASTGSSSSSSATSSPQHPADPSSDQLPQLLTAADMQRAPSEETPAQAQAVQTTISGSSQSTGTNHSSHNSQHKPDSEPDVIHINLEGIHVKVKTIEPTFSPPTQAKQPLLSLFGNSEHS